MREKLSQYWELIQGKLFPCLEEELGPLTERHEQVITAIEFARVGRFIRHYHGVVGCPEKDRASIARAFIAKAIYNFQSTEMLIDRLRCDPVLRRICGWERKEEIPSSSTFSRAYKEFSEIGLPSRIHEAFIETHHSSRIIGHISRDSTAIEAREKATSKPEQVEKATKKRGRPCKGEVRPLPDPTRIQKQPAMSLEEALQDLPKPCDIGTKRNSKGHQESWKGYKFHIDTADGDIPISAILTSASVHDSQVAIPLSKTTSQRVLFLYEVMDAAYDSKDIRSYSVAQGHVPLIDFNRRGANDNRAFYPHEAQRYKERSAAERVNSNLKDNFGARSVRVRGHAKVLAHLMFGLLALAIDQTVRMLN